MHTFKKEERLCNKRLLKKLFTSGSSFLVYPFRVVHMPEATSDHYPVQVVVAVPKRKFKKAVDRNLLKRRIREAYRLHKDTHLYPVLTRNDTRIILSLSYIGNEIADYKIIEKKLLTVLKHLHKAYDREDN
ncbi:ribonuclease P protein component [Arcticibacter sp.]|uniref:ribonuclease P protein component n=1 Tax=Arcticibacter sp. TaxID=1872630 RepID=UPI00388D52D0